jgi:succinyl-diaminopimelate desuccinylase
MDWTGVAPDAVAALLGRLIRCESPDPPGDERKVARVLVRALRDLGFSPEVEEFAPHRLNVVVRIKGQGTRAPLVFCAHLDTVPAITGVRGEHDASFSGHFDGTHVHGRGANDMKSGVVAMVCAAASLQGSPLGGDLILAFTGGAAAGGLGAKRLLARKALSGAGAVVIGAPTGLRVALAQKAALWLRVAARNTDGQSAVVAMMGFLGRVQSALPHDRHPLLGPVTAQVGTIAGGTALHVIPEFCVAELDLRLLPHHDPDRIQQGVQDMAGDGFTVTRIALMQAVETPADNAFAALCLAQSLAVTGLPSDPVGVARVADAAVLGPALGVPVAMIGPGQPGRTGAADDSVLLADVMTAARIHARIAKGWLGV